MNDHPTTQEVLAPVVKSVVVKLLIQAAFRLFTEEMHTWWPLVTHSVGGEQAEGCFLEGWVGGRIFEQDKDGSESEWGRVLVWEPPHRLVFTFYPGRTPDSSQEVEVAFLPEENGTRLTLTHRGWERLGDLAAVRRLGYDRGWEIVLGEYIDRANSKIAE